MVRKSKEKKLTEAEQANAEEQKRMIEAEVMKKREEKNKAKAGENKQRAVLTRQRGQVVSYNPENRTGIIKSEKGVEIHVVATSVKFNPLKGLVAGEKVTFINVLGFNGMNADVAAELVRGSECLVCGKGHMVRDCPEKEKLSKSSNSSTVSSPSPSRASSVVSGSEAGEKKPPTLNNGTGRTGEQEGRKPRPRTCFNCKSPDHMVQDCKEPRKQRENGNAQYGKGEQRRNVNTQRRNVNTCYNCQSPDHMAKDCKQKMEEGSCYNCGQTGHMARFCTEPKKTKVPVCYSCNEAGHVWNNCTQERKPRTNSNAGNAVCYNCNEVGHLGRECTREAKPRRNGKSRNGKCYNCGYAGHVAKECQEPCRKCGELGHMPSDCTNGNRCFKCGEGGHFARECHNTPAPTVA